MILSSAEAEAVIEAVVPVDLVDAGGHSFDYPRLTDAQFELLLYSLAKSSAPQEVDRTWSTAALMPQQTS